MKKCEGDVIFEKPDIRALADEGFTTCDMHFHTNHSDSATRVKDLLKLAGKIGSGVSITDHNQISGYFEARRFGGDVFLIPGIEVSSADGPHILLYFFDHSSMKEYYDRYILPNKQKSPYMAIKMSSFEIFETTEDYGCLRVPAHPFGYFFLERGMLKLVEKGRFPKEIVDSFDAVEAVCGGMTRRLNEKAAMFADKHKLSVTGGTDGHLLRDLGGVVTCSPDDEPSEFLESIYKRRNFVIGTEKDPINKGLTAAAIAVKFSPYTLRSLQVHYRQNSPRVRTWFDKNLKR